VPSELCGLVDGRGGQSHRCSALRCEDSRAMPSVRPTVGSQSSQSGAHHSLLSAGLPMGSTGCPL